MGQQFFLIFLRVPSGFAEKTRFMEGFAEIRNLPAEPGIFTRRFRGAAGFPPPAAVAPARRGSSIRSAPRSPGKR